MAPIGAVPARARTATLAQAAAPSPAQSCDQEDSDSVESIARETRFLAVVFIVSRRPGICRRAIVPLFERFSVQS
jgi:hypothetical protein